MFDDKFTQEKTMIRARFKTAAEDFRPITTSDKYPWWWTGSDVDGNAIIVAYEGNEFSLINRWPEMFEAEWESRDEIIYTDRFPRPDYIQD